MRAFFEIFKKIQITYIYLLIQRTEQTLNPFSQPRDCSLLIWSQFTPVDINLFACTRLQTVNKRMNCICLYVGQFRWRFDKVRRAVDQTWFTGRRIGIAHAISIVEVTRLAIRVLAWTLARTRIHISIKLVRYARPSRANILVSN